jgi:hypothetical protein
MATWAPLVLLSETTDKGPEIPYDVVFHPSSRAFSPEIRRKRQSCENRQTIPKVPLNVVRQPHPHPPSNTAFPTAPPNGIYIPSTDLLF